MEIELKHLIKCPNCKDGQIVHYQGKYCCSDSHVCNFEVPGTVYGKTIRKTALVSLIRKKYLEPFSKDLFVFSKTKTVSGFIVLDSKNNLGFLYPNRFPISLCPKCNENEVFMRYSERKDSYYYSCKDFEKCGFILPYFFRNKPLSIDNIKKICAFKKISKTYKSKAQKLYTVNVFLNKSNLTLQTSY